MVRPDKRFFATLRMTGAALILFFSVAAASNRTYAADDPCGPVAVGAFIKEKLQRNWNQGTVRAWEEQGAFWSMQIGKDLGKLKNSLKTEWTLPCEVIIADLASFSARVLPKGLPIPSTNELMKEIKSEKAQSKSSGQKKEVPNIISPIGTTLGIFEPTKGEMILIMYPAKIASAIARGKGTSPRKDLKEVLSAFPAELDIEYNFGEFVIQIFGGTGKSSMREAADKAFGDLRRLGYQPGPGSDKSIAAFDGIFPPDHHESFWLHKNGALRVELEKIKHGQVRINIHETKQRQ